MARAGNPFGDGTASAQIVAELERSLVGAPVAQPALA
jgi:UDP-N-acetylglucosamine 2-epimerase (non-hydrolysing)